MDIINKFIYRLVYTKIFILSDLKLINNMAKAYKDSTLKLTDITTAINFEDCIRQLRYYFLDINKVREKIFADKIIDTPCVIFQKDRRGVNRKKGIRNDQKRHLRHPWKLSNLK